MNEQIVEVKGVVAPTVAITPKKHKVYGSFGHSGEANWIMPLGFEITSNILDADVVVFGGGKDVDPGFYNEKRGRTTDAPNERDRREKKDFELVQILRKEGKIIKTLGICRGAQLLCALSGGALLQDVGNHCGEHSLSTFDKKTLTVNSIHHQMMFPYRMDKKNYKILGWSTRNISSHYHNGWGKNRWLPAGFKELEIVYFTNTDSLGIQFHPEMMFRYDKYNETMNWLQQLFMRFFKSTL